MNPLGEEETSPVSTPANNGSAREAVPAAPRGHAAAPMPHEHEHHVPITYRSGTTRRMVLAAVAVLAVLLIALILTGLWRHRSLATLQSQTNSNDEKPLTVDVVRVRRAAPGVLLTLPGDARGFYETTIYARISGYVSKWMVDIGDHVKAGQIMAEIDTPELDDQLREAHARDAQLLAQANVASTSADFARVSYNRWEAAAPDGVVSAQERDEKKSALEAAKARLEAANAETRLGAAQTQRLETLEKFKQVTAPFDGIVTQRFIDIGALATAGSTTNTTPLYSIAQSGQIRVFVDAPQAAIGAIHVGMHASAVARELPERTFVGVVDRTSSSLDPKSRTLRVEVLIDNPQLILMPGMYLQVSLKSERAQPPLQIPAAALAFGPAGPRVAVVNDDGTVSIRAVKIAKDLGDVLDIDAGISENEKVALNVGSQVSDGQRVEARLADEASPTAPGAPAQLPAPNPSAPAPSSPANPSIPTASR